MGRERRRFTDEFKTEAVALLASSGRPLVQIAGELGVSPAMLRNWRNGDYRKILQATTMTQAISQTANCWDNAPKECFCGTLKTERVPQRADPDREPAPRDLFASLTAYYKRRPIHAAIGSLPPAAARPKIRITQWSRFGGKV